MMRSRSALLSVCSAMVALVPLFGMAQDDYAIVRSRVVNEASAHLLRPVFVNATGTRELQRYFNCTSHEDRDKGMELLERWASAKNTGAYTQLVTDPEADRQVYEGDWVQNQVTVEMQSTPSMIIQSLVKLIDMGATSTNALAALQAASYLISRDNQILDLFNFETGEGDNLTLVWYNLEPDSQTMCMETISDAQLVSTFASGWTYADRSWKEAENGSATFAIHFRKIAWNTWANTNAADITEYDSTGDSTERQRITKTWMHIRRADIDTAVTDLKSGTGGVSNETGYSIIDVNVQSEGNGAISLAQTQIKQVTSTNANASALDKPGLFPGLGTDTVVRYENFPIADLPASTAPTTGNAIISNERIGPDANGLYGRVVVSRATTWANTWNNAIQLGDGPNTWNQHKRDYVGGVDDSTYSTLLTAMMIPSATNKVVLNASVSPGPGGSISGSRTEGTAYSTLTDFLVVQIGSSEASQSDRLGRLWHRRTLTAKDNLVANAAVSDYTYSGTIYTHSSCRISDNGDGTYDVTQSLLNTGSDGAGGTVTNLDVNVYWVKNWTTYTVRTKSEDEEIKVWTYGRHIEREPTASTAWNRISAASNVVYGSDGVAQVSPTVYEARWTTLDSISPWGVNTYAP